MLRRTIQLFVLLVLATSFEAEGGVGGRSDNDKDVVKRKLFTKRKRIEINGPNVGVILNQSYLDSFLIHGGINYFFSEVWGVGLEGAVALNSDKFARECVESFINDPDNEVTDECGGTNVSGEGRANFGPAYVPIREIENIVAINAVWNPVYGKQLLFKSATNYFDLFFTMGAGLAFSKFYPKRTVLNNGKAARGAIGEEDPLTVGAESEETDSYGIEGRPIPESQSNVLINLGIGQKYHFWKRFNLKAELRNYTLVGTEAGFDNFFTLWGGVGLRF